LFILETEAELDFGFNTVLFDSALKALRVSAKPFF
jgi:hypothetical protein